MVDKEAELSQHDSVFTDADIDLFSYDDLYRLLEMPVEEDELKALQESAKSHDQNVANTSLSIQASSSTSVQHGGSPSSDTTITCANDPAMHNSRSFKYCNTDDSFTLESTSGTTAKIAHNNIQCPSENSLIGTNVQGNLRNCSSNSNLKRSVPSNGDTVQGKNCFPVERETLELIELSSSDDEREPSRKRWKEASICNTSSVDRNTHGYISGISEHPYVPDVHRKLPSDWGTMRSVNAVGKGSMKVLQSNVITNDRIHDGRDLVHDHANVNSRKVQQHTSTGSMDSGSEEFSVRGVSLYEISGWNSSRSPNDDSSRLQRQNMSNINQKQNSLEAKPQPGHFQQNDGLCFDLNSKYIPSNQHSPSPFQCNVIDGKTKISDKRIWNHGLVNGEMLKHKNKRLLPPSLGARGHPSVIAQHVSSSKEEKRTYRAALMDLEQPTTEASPDDGLLAVPLLKHQRIALAWMVEKENTNQFCAGGILADDQGLGKTVSAISLILKERPRKSPQDDLNRMKAQSCTVNLDEDEAAEALCELSAVKPSCSLHLAGTDVCEQASVPTIKRGRPSAGTLVVCPTSVLRQWAQEIQDKVTQEANLRVLVYHGSNRTKDPEEVAKYDVVLTTYSIVSQEVPKQEAYEEQEETDDAALCAAFTKKRKRKISDSKKVKKRKGKNASSSDPGPGVLARINWFRVVLDEAQTIKNHRTQVSRACWSLRAKKRWCLSGTPIQNSIDDLYSYFRFLRHELFASYKSFCDIIKLPISRDPNTGYKKLQLILRTVMLRRTKATLIDGEPVISLPPKTITLNKVDFSKEERDFYCRLEAESRAQFRVYAAEGTVKQNYVNILLMLLHLRQACNHPLLVKNSSTKNWTSSLKAVKKLSREKQIDLMKNLEGSVALCCICNDAPEEAVISLCNHIFCNQCIADYFAQRDDTVCPSPNCKSDINKENIFSANALRHCIRNGDDDDDTNPLQEDNYSKFEIPDFGSSKIKAALEVLKSITQVRSGISSKSAISDESGRHVRVSEWSAENSVDMLDPQDPDPEPAQKKRIIERPEKAIVFSQWTSMLDLLEGALQKSGIQYRRLDGTMSVCARDKAVNDFKTLPEVTVMIMSLKAASLGLNMVAASHVIMLDLWWNPTTEDQAIDRAHRIGQTRHVHVCRLTVKDTVEDRILALQEKKREMVSSAFGEDDSGRHGSRLTEEDLHYLFRL